jgi:ADP-dependent NAD(P)H-hydrate dehydratase
MTQIRELDVDALKEFPLPENDGDTDKDSRGRVLLIGGSTLSPGALLLSGLAALRGGAGKLLVATAEPIARDIGLIAPEFGVVSLRATDTGEPDGEDETLDQYLEQCDAVLLGPGMMDEENARLLALRLMNRLKVPLVLDAAAITSFSEDFAPLRQFAAPKILTPHAGEMAKLIGIAKQRVQDSPAEIARKAADDLRSTVILKGATTYITSPAGTLWRHAGGVCGLATAGSGDALAGLLAALIARGLSPIAAALWSVVTHSTAGTKLTHSIGPVGFLARELPDTFPAILRELAER